ncbi:ComF family protein [Pseudomonas sp. N040]|uniref:ComF family protein n=1 Tax=Pseudomonas sp. N040 TaxID=2785325 RepID=UPI0018A283E8|nr:ComF family protein [Pseudomonas sp. N040]MBF7728516.1 ComF family protein [Pseudomonas sp. N040]MBW7012156.1 ComF family protein [Pseudomonas sp. N040]
MSCQPSRMNTVYKWLNNNQHCLLCAQPAHSPVPLCTDCEVELPWLGPHCRICAIPLAAEGLACGECLRKPPAFTHVEAAWRYRYPVDSLITGFKHQSRWPQGRLLAELLAAHLRHAFDHGLPRPAFLLPVPLTKRRLRQRGFNQAGLLANWLGQALELPVESSWLLRLQDAPAQQQLDAAARKRNLRQAFGLAGHARITGQHLALVDDVMTTGATAEAAARLLIKAGAARVDLYCLARTPRPGD